MRTRDVRRTLVTGCQCPGNPCHRHREPGQLAAPREQEARMDGTRFDRMTQAVSSGLSRRHAVLGLPVLFLGVGALLREGSETSAKHGRGVHGEGRNHRRRGRNRRRHQQDPPPPDPDDDDLPPVCPAGQVACGGRCVAACPVGQQLDALCKCACPGSRILCNGRCESPVCAGDTTFNTSVCKCVCPDGRPGCLGGVCRSPQIICCPELPRACRQADASFECIASDQCCPLIERRCPAPYPQDPRDLCVLVDEECCYLEGGLCPLADGTTGGCCPPGSRCAYTPIPDPPFNAPVCCSYATNVVCGSTCCPTATHHCCSGGLCMLKERPC